MTDREVLMLRGWVHALEEERISKWDFGRLQEMLRESEAARQEYVRMMGVSASLVAYADEMLQGEDGEVAAVVAGSGVWPISAKLVAVLAILLGIWGIHGALDGRVAEMEQAGEVMDDGLAVLTKEIDTRWVVGGRAYGAGGRVPKGVFQMEAGLAQLEFYCGARMVLEGPVEMEVRSPESVWLKRGTMRVVVPPHAKGFEVETAGFGLVGPGTGYGVRVEADGDEEVQVIEGVVELRVGGEPVRKLAAGEVYSTAGDEVGYAPEGYVGTEGLGARMAVGVRERENTWRGYIAGLGADGRLGLFYGFEPDLGDDRRLVNEGRFDSAGADGAIVGARWSEGRWPGRRALDFEGSGDRVRVDVAGEYDAITLAAWVRVDSLERKYNALFLTDGFAPGNPHWQIEGDGRLVFGVKKEAEDSSQYAFWSEALGGVFSKGAWVHLAVTFDTRTGKGYHYVNGERVMAYRAEGKVDTKIKIGPAELGNWGLPTETDLRPVRNLDGKIGAFWLYTEALADVEVREIFNGGNKR